MKKVAKDKPVLGRNELSAIAKRILKDGAYVPARDMPVFYKLIAQYPVARFWQNYDIGFRLNAAFWLLGADGQEKLKRDFAIFNLDFAPPVPQTLESNKVGEDIVTTPQKPKNLADFLK